MVWKHNIMFKILYLVFLLAFCRISDAEFYVDDVKNVISEKGVSKLTELMSEYNFNVKNQPKLLKSQQQYT